MLGIWLTQENALVIFTLCACTPLYSLTSGDLWSRANAAVSSLCGRSGSSFCLHLSKLLQNSNQRLELIRFSWQRTMIQNLIVPLLLSLLTYYYLPAPETNLLGKTNINDRDVVFSNDIIFSCFSVQRWKPFKEHVGENWKIEVSTNIRFLPETLNIFCSQIWFQNYSKHGRSHGACGREKQSKNQELTSNVNFENTINKPFLSKITTTLSLRKILMKQI